ncbi:MAG: glycoside hydrolase family 172 protein [Terracidiphilus sp.]
MQPSGNPESFRARRKLLGTIGSAAALLSLSAAGAAAGETRKTASAAPPTAPEPAAPEELFALSRLRNYKTRRSSSWDRTGGNGDAVAVEAGQTATLLEATGAGVVTHLWFTINSRDPMHLKNLVLRAWWDGESTPSVEVPIGDFFGLGLGEYYTYQSALLAVAPMKALNAYFEMPFSTSARLTLTNEGKVRTDNLYFAVDYVTLPSLPADVARFHAQYRQAAPCKGWTDNWMNNWDNPVGDRKNLSGADNYVFLEAEGRGHFVGVTHAVEQNQDEWFGEGDDMIFIDGDPMPTINGTGTEDYYNGAWDFGGQPFGYQHNGAPYIVDPERIGGRYCLYRWHLESPITFEKSIRVTMEHGHANHRSDDFYTTAFWYQTEPHAAFPALPAPAERVPKVFRVGGPGAAPVPGSKTE